MPRPIRPMLLTAALASLTATAASAVVVTQTFTLTGSGFTDHYVFGPPYTGPVPVDPAHLSFTVTFDNALTYTDSTSGITLLSTDLPAATPISFTTFQHQYLYVGGTQGGAAGLSFASNDYQLVFRYMIVGSTLLRNPDTSPELAYSTTAANDYFTTFAVTGFPAAVPEPGTWALLIAGMAAVGGAGRRRRRVAPG